MKKFKTPEKYLYWIILELENANYHNQTPLPEKLFNRIKNNNLIGSLDKKYQLELARIIAEEFYKNI